MRVVAVDDERMALNSMLKKLRSIDTVTEAQVFQAPNEALDYIRTNEVDVAFLDINMRQMDGLILAKKVKEIKPRTYVVFVTGYSEYAVEAFHIHASGYLLKPASVDDIKEELQIIDNPSRVQSIYDSQNRVRIQCFGDFEVFLDGNPIHFKRSKTKEVLAYLVDRVGAATNTSTLCTILWEDELTTMSMKSQLRNCISELIHVFEDVGLDDVILRNRNSFAINTEAIECDYYNFRKRKPEAVNLYFGEYMSQYGWAEMTLGAIESGIES